MIILAIVIGLVVIYYEHRIETLQKNLLEELLLRQSMATYAHQLETLFEEDIPPIEKKETLSYYKTLKKHGAPITALTDREVRSLWLKKNEDVRQELQKLKQQK